MSAARVQLDLRDVDRIVCTVDCSVVGPVRRSGQRQRPGGYLRRSGYLEIDFRIRRLNPLGPGTHERAGSCSHGMQSIHGKIARVEEREHISGSQIAQLQVHFARRVLALLPMLRFLIRPHPVVDSRIACYYTTQRPRLQIAELQPVRESVLGRPRRDANPTVVHLPKAIAYAELSSRRKSRIRPLAIALNVRGASRQFLGARDGACIGNVHLAFVAAAQLRMHEVLNFPREMQMRSTRGKAQALDVQTSAGETELQIATPREGAQVLKLCVHLLKMDFPFVSPPEQ